MSCTTCQINAPVCNGVGELSFNPLHFVTELQSNLPAILSEFRGCLNRAKSTKSSTEMRWAKARFPAENKCIPGAALPSSGVPTPLVREGLRHWQWALCCRHSWESSPAGSCSPGSSCLWLCCYSFSLPTSGSNWWRVSTKPHKAEVGNPVPWHTFGMSQCNVSVSGKPRTTHLFDL